MLKAFLSFPTLLSYRLDERPLGNTSSSGVGFFIAADVGNHADPELDYAMAKNPEVAKRMDVRLVDTLAKIKKIKDMGDSGKMAYYETVNHPFRHGAIPKIVKRGRPHKRGCEKHESNGQETQRARGAI